MIPFPRVLVLCEMQSVSSRIWTHVTASISYDDNHYTTGTSITIKLTVVCQWLKRSWFNPRSSHTKDSKKWYLMPSCLTLCIIRYGSRESGALQGNESYPPLHFYVVVIEKGAFGSPSGYISIMWTFIIIALFHNSWYI